MRAEMFKDSDVGTMVQSLRNVANNLVFFCGKFQDATLQPVMRHQLRQNIMVEAMIDDGCFLQSKSTLTFDP